MRILFSESWNRWNIFDADEIPVQDVPCEGAGLPYKSDALMRLVAYLMDRDPDLVLQQISENEIISVKQRVLL
jgi:hypothetical protein